MDSTIPISHAVVLGIVQGLGEFLPISSSAHLIVASWLMDGKPLPLTLNLAMHFGTFVAVMIYFWRDWIRLLKATVARLFKGQKSFESDTLLPGLLIGSVPAGVLGILFDDKIEAVFHHPATVVLPMALVGWFLWWIDNKRPATKLGGDITIKDAFLIGCGQACALIPGVSRSGATIMTGRLLNIRRDEAARFSFLLGTPAIAGAVILKFKALMASAQDPVFYVGAGVSFLVGCAAIGGLLRFLRTSGFAAFAIYRVVFAVFVVIMLFVKN